MGQLVIRGEVNQDFKAFLRVVILGSKLDPNDDEAKKLIKNGETMLHGGSISLQSESHPIEFRKVEIRELKD